MDQHNIVKLIYSNHGTPRRVPRYLVYIFCHKCTFSSISNIMTSGCQIPFKFNAEQILIYFLLMFTDFSICFNLRNFPQNNTRRLDQNGEHFTDGIFKCFFFHDRNLYFDSNFTEAWIQLAIRQCCFRAIARTRETPLPAPMTCHFIDTFKCY